MRGDGDEEELVLPTHSSHALMTSSTGDSSLKTPEVDHALEDDCPFTLDNLRHWMYLSLGLIVALLLIINLSSAKGSDNNTASSSTSCTSCTTTSTTSHVFDTTTMSLLSSGSKDDQANSFLSLYSDKEHTGSTQQVYAKLSKWVVDKQAPLLYVEQITKGVGIVDLFWDPADIISQDEVKFRLDPSASKVLLFARQSHFRGDKYLMQESFAESMLGSFPIVQTDDVSYWVDFSSFVHSNVGLVQGKDLASAISTVYGSQYCYGFNADLSYLDSGVVKGNAYRSTFQSVLTYSMCNKAGINLPLKYFEQTLASSTHLSISVRRSFIKLRPLNLETHSITNDDDDDGYSKTGVSSYVPRWFHPKSGFNSISYRDEDKSLWSSRLTQYITRFNLNSVNNNKIQFYIDSNIPQPYLSAITEGVMWWDDAFQFAGYKAGTFSAQVAPTDFDPFDFYEDGSSFVHWIDRDVRFYSIGLRVIDPRTGEVLKGHVRLEGLRMRQDALLAQALLSKESYGNELQRKGDIFSCVLQRVRHLGAHEVGHSLGLTHNFAGSTAAAGYSSVMDYPLPIVQMKDGQLKLNEESYSSGIGMFDKVAVKYGYSAAFTSDRMEVEQQQLVDFLASAEQQYGYVFLTDGNSMDSAVDWRDTKWDLGVNPIASLQSSMEVRKKALESLNLNSFVENNIPESRLLELFPLIYLWHRYQVEAVTKLIAGRNISYDLKTDHSAANTFIAADVQRQAVAKLANALSPAEVTIPTSITSMSLSAVAFGYSVDVGSSGDLFSSRFGEGLLDPVAVYETYAQLVLDNIFALPRLERMAYQKTVNSSLPNVEDVTGILYNNLFDTATTTQMALCANNMLEVTTIQSSFINAILKVQSASKQMSSLAQRGVAGAKYNVQTQLMALGRKSADTLCDSVSSSCTSCVDNAKLYLEHVQFLVSKVLGSTDYLAQLAVPIGPPL